ncbi:hypothetical protein BAMA111019_23510 [Bacillus manliponensis]
MSNVEIIYTSSEVYNRLGISGSTLRKYMDVLSEKATQLKKIVMVEESTQNMTLFLLNS